MAAKRLERMNGERNRRKQGGEAVAGVTNYIQKSVTHSEPRSRHRLVGMVGKTRPIYSGEAKQYILCLKGSVVRHIGHMNLQL